MQDLTSRGDILHNKDFDMKLRAHGHLHLLDYTLAFKI